MQVYRSGHNEAVLKTVWVKAHGGSNPSACAKSAPWDTFFIAKKRRDSKGEPIAGAIALP